MKACRFFGLSLASAGLIACALTAAPRTADATNLVLNGDFELGNQDFTSGYSVFFVDNASEIPNQGFSDWTTATDAFGGDSNVFFGGPPGGPSGGPFATAWEQTVNVLPGTDYTFSFYGVDINSLRNSDAILQAYVNGTPVATLNTTHDWASASGLWNSGVSTTAILTLLDVNNAFQFNDFALDNISFAGPVATTPIPAASLLFASALGGLGLAGWRRKKATAA